MKKVCYLLEKFPRTSETFILNEITGLIDIEYPTEIISLDKTKDSVIHEQYFKYNLDKKTVYLPFKENEKREEYTSFEIFTKGTRDLFSSKILNRKEKFKLLSLCYDPVMGREIALKKFSSVLKIIKVIKERKIEHLHLHFATDAVELACILHQLSGIPYTFTTHAFDIFVSPSVNIKKWAGDAKKVVTISEFNKKYMNEQLDIPLEKIEVVPNSKYLQKLMPIKEYRTSPFKIISVSRIVEKKGYPYLVEACGILKEKGIEFCCEIQGEGPQKAELKRLIKENNLEKEIKLGGALAHKEVLQFMGTGSVFVLPCIRAHNNDMDGTPNVLMESMAIEVPTISTDVTGIPEFIDDEVNGIIVPQKNPEALAEAILKIKNNPVFAEKIRKRSREKIKDKFNVEKNVSKMAKIFER